MAQSCADGCTRSLLGLALSVRESGPASSSAKPFVEAGEHEAMDPDILAIVAAQGGQDAAPARRQGASNEALAKARAAKAEKRSARVEAQGTATTSQVQVASLCIPGCGVVMGLPEQGANLYRSNKPWPLEAMCRLSVSPRIRGSGAVVERVRKMQNVSVALVGSAALEMQRAGFDKWVVQASAPAAGEHRVLGMSIMWDEATQNTKAVLTKMQELPGNTAMSRAGNSQTVVQVMVTLGTVHEMTASVLETGQVERRSEWQPWVAAPQFVTSTGHAYLLKALSRSMPVALGSPRDVEEFLRCGEEPFVASMCFDFAASNVRAFATMVQATSGHLDRLFLHGERCATHCIHLVKSSCIAATKLAGMLYSVSKVLRLNRSVDGLRHSLAAHIRVRLEFRQGQPPDNGGFMATLLDLLVSDGDRSLVDTPSGFSAWFQDVKAMATQSRFDLETGKWIFWLPQGWSLADEGLQNKAINFILEPMVKVFVLRRWESATLSRWTGVSRCLKRMALGVVMNGAFPAALGSLAQRLSVTEAGLARAMEAHHAKVLAGEESDDTTIKDMGRILRVSAFFQDPGRKVEVGITLKAVALIDTLHWQVLGERGRRPKADLASMVDPTRSIVARLLHKALDLFGGWGADLQWGFLRYFGLASFEDADARRFARNALLSLSAGLFRRLEQRFASFPYRLQWLISDTVSRARKEGVAMEFIQAPACCLGPFGRAFRCRFPDVSAIFSPQAESVLLSWAVQIRFSTAPVECEHKMVKDEAASLTTGSSKAPLALRTVCRHLHQAHCHRGGRNIALPLRRVRLPVAGHLRGEMWPSSGTPAIADSGEDAQPRGGEAALPLDDQAPDSIDRLISEHKLGGGNPKAVFLNYELHKAKVSRGGAEQQPLPVMMRLLACRTGGSRYSPCCGGESKRSKSPRQARRPITRCPTSGRRTCSRRRWRIGAPSPLHSLSWRSIRRSSCPPTLSWTTCWGTQKGSKSRHARSPRVSRPIRMPSHALRAGTMSAGAAWLRKACSASTTSCGRHGTDGRAPCRRSRPLQRALFACCEPLAAPRTLALGC